MLYVVGGWGRAGTSMMMTCLEAGGMDAVYDRVDLREVTKRITNFYNYDGKLIKVWRKNIARIHDDLPTQMVYMLRDPAAIKRSADKFFGGKWTEERIADEQQQWLDYAVNSEHINVIPIQYEDVCAEPHKTFSMLESEFYPIDVERAASVVAVPVNT